MTAPRPGLTYWRCPECGTRVGFTARMADRLGVKLSVPYGSGPSGWQWDFLSRRWLERAESIVEAHEARHGIGAA